MHEMSLAAGIIRVLEQTQQREGFRLVTALRLEAGALSGVEVRALRFALESMQPGSLIEGAVITIDEPPAQAWCMPCGASVHIQSRLDACPVCGSSQIHPTGDNDLRVVDLRVID